MHQILNFLTPTKRRLERAFNAILAGQADPVRETLLWLESRGLNQTINYKRLKAGLHHLSGDDAEALSIYQSVIEHGEADTDIYVDMANIYIKQQSLKQAQLCLEKISELRTPKDRAYLADARYDHMTGNCSLALEKLKKISKKSINDPNIQIFLAHIYCNTGNYKDAEKILNHHARKNKKDFRLDFLHYNILAASGNYAAALHMLDQTLAQNPPYQDNLLFLKAAFFFRRGQHSTGWAIYNQITDTRAVRPRTDIPAVPQWAGEYDKNLCLFLIHEQGLGDSLQFIRYAEMCRRRVGRVVACMPKPLQRLFAASPFVDEVIDSKSVTSSDFLVGDYTGGLSRLAQISLMSLPEFAQPNADTIPHNFPYHSLSDEARKKWSGTIPPSPRKKIGVVWSGSTPHDHASAVKLTAAQRNTTLETLFPIFSAIEADFYSLQMPREGVQEEIDRLGLTGRLVDVMDGVADFMDTAAIVAQLDLIIAVDTSIVHLAGGMGKPVWVLSRYNGCWRWLDNQPTNNPWYPQAHVFGQPTPGDWKSVVQNVVEALQKV